MDEAMFFYLEIDKTIVALFFNKISRDCTYVEQLKKIIINCSHVVTIEDSGACSTEIYC